jgi:2-iminobutanoate/2-iminopropanoate deaminase
MQVEPVRTPSAPGAAGPYSPAVRAGDWIVCSGQIGIDPATGELAGEGIEDEARQALANLSAVLADCGCGWEHVAKVTVFVASSTPSPMPAVNEIYEQALGACRPARSTVGVAWLPKDASFEIEAWVYNPENRPEAS